MSDNITPDRLRYERQLWEEGYTRVMGLDEVGRGCLAGPVVAAGVMLKPGSTIPAVRDSKLIELKEREELAEIIKDKALYWTIQHGEVEEIEEINILWASIAAMQKCEEEQGGDPDYLLVDGNRYTGGMVPHNCIIKGDDRSMSIAAASILAKVYRDRLMKNLHEEYPYYGWITNVGYPTGEHYRGLKEYGYTIHHRRNFNLRTDKPFEETVSG